MKELIPICFSLIFFLFMFFLSSYSLKKDKKQEEKEKIDGKPFDSFGHYIIYKTKLFKYGCIFMIVVIILKFIYIILAEYVF